MLTHQCRVKGRRSVFLAITAGHKVEEDVEVFKTQHTLRLGDLLACVGGIVAQGADELHSAPNIYAHNVTEIFAVHETNEAIIIGHDKVAVHRVHPFDGKLHGAAAVDDRCRGVDMVDLFRRHRHRGEGMKLWVRG